MKFLKPSTTIDDQIATLRQRGLIIKDVNAAKHYLKNISYYRLAGYWWPLQSDKKNHLFKPNSTFETVMKIYGFDQELRVLLFDAIEKIEIAFRTRLSNEMCNEVDPWWFEDPNNFNNKTEHSATLNAIDGELKRCKEGFIAEHKRKYHLDTRRPPSWKTLEILSLGTLSKLYGNLKSGFKAKNRIAASLGTVNVDYLPSWLQDLTQIRNICAHHGRIWNRNLPGRPKLLPNPPHAWITNVPHVSQHHNLYIHLCCIKYLLNVIMPGNAFTYRLYFTLRRHRNIDLNALGMNKDWHKEKLWNNKMAMPYISYRWYFEVLAYRFRNSIK